MDVGQYDRVRLMRTTSMECQHASSVSNDLEQGVGMSFTVLVWLSTLYNMMTDG